MNKSELLATIKKHEAIRFGTWYSGMEREKVAKAYDRYLEETKKQ